jgi:hypothetical protein
MQLPRFFNRKLLKAAQSGDDFRDFVGEFLRAEGLYGRPEPRDSGGRDGCIDLMSTEQGIVVECKDVGPSADTETDRVFGEWRSVRGKLSKALASRNGVADPTSRPYAPWADAASPIRQYLFVTSALLANEARHRELAADIRTFFQTEIAERPGYGHLRTVAVEVIDWRIIATKLSDKPALVFRWLERWPSGFADLAGGEPEGNRRASAPTSTLRASPIFPATVG